MGSTKRLMVAILGDDGKLYDKGTAASDIPDSAGVKGDVWETGTASAESSSAGKTTDGIPPKSGKGSGAKAWTEYAASNDVEVPDGASREDIIGLLEAADIATE